MLLRACGGRAIWKDNWSSACTPLRKDLRTMVHLTKTAKIRLGVQPTTYRARSASSASRTAGTQTTRVKSAISTHNHQQREDTLRPRPAVKNGQSTRVDHSKSVAIINSTKDERCQTIKWTYKDHSPKKGSCRPSGLARAQHLHHKRPLLTPSKVNDKPEGKTSQIPETLSLRSHLGQPMRVAELNILPVTFRKCTMGHPRRKERSTVCVQSTKQEIKDGNVGERSLSEVSTKMDKTSESKMEQLLKGKPERALLMPEKTCPSIAHNLLSPKPSCTTHNSRARYQLQKPTRSAADKTRCCSTEMGRLLSRNYTDLRNRDLYNRSKSACSIRNVKLGLCPSSLNVDNQSQTAQRKHRNNTTQEKPKLIKSHVDRMSHSAAGYLLGNELNVDCNITKISGKRRVKDLKSRRAKDKVNYHNCGNNHGDNHCEYLGENDNVLNHNSTLSSDKIESAYESNTLVHERGKMHRSKYQPSVITMKQETISPTVATDEYQSKYADGENVSNFNLMNWFISDDRVNNIYECARNNDINNCLTATDTGGQSFRSTLHLINNSAEKEGIRNYIGRRTINKEHNTAQDVTDNYSRQEQQEELLPVISLTSLSPKEIKAYDFDPDVISDRVKVQSPHRRSMFIADDRVSEKTQILPESDWPDRIRACDRSTNRSHSHRGRIRRSKPTLTTSPRSITNKIGSPTNKTINEVKSDSILSTEVVANDTYDLDGYESDASSGDGGYPNELEYDYDGDFISDQTTKIPRGGMKRNDEGMQSYLYGTKENALNTRTEYQDYTNAQNYDYDFRNSSAYDNSGNGDCTVMLDYSQVCQSWKKSLRYLKDPAGNDRLIPVDDYMLNKYNRIMPVYKFPDHQNFALILKESYPVKHPNADLTDRELLQVKRHYGFVREPTDLVRRISFENARYFSGKVDARPYTHLD